jgi:hypothetical protein
MNPPHYTIDEARLAIASGPVLDLGCLHWNWSARFANKHPVIGVDPFETRCPSWATLIRAAVSIGDGTIAIANGVGVGNSCLFHFPAETVPAVSFQRLLDHYKPALVKMNIEGAEYPLLLSVRHPIADQLIVAFHDRDQHPASPFDASATEFMLGYLAQWYEPAVCTCPQWKWYLFRSSSPI